jgi:hypothetical protein
MEVRMRILCCAVALTLALPVTANSDKEIAKLIAQFSDDEKAMAAVDKVSKMGPRAVDQLKGLALERQDTVARGWAIAALGYIGDENAKAALKKIAADGKNSQLVRTWAQAAQIEAAKNFDELVALAPLANSQRALMRPLQKRMSVLAADANVEDLLTMAISNYQLQPSLTGPILDRGAEPLVTAMATSKNQQVRRQAAAYLGTLANRVGVETVAKLVIDRYRFKKGAKDVAWAGGPLFVPGIQYDQKNARKLVTELLKWHVWCDMKGKAPQQQQIHNNIRGVGIARMGGYPPQLGRTDVHTWLRVWKDTVGASKVKAMLKEVGAPAKYRKGI